MLVFYSSFILTSVDDTNYHFEVAKMWEFAVYLWAGMDLIEGVISFWVFIYPQSLNLTRFVNEY